MATTKSTSDISAGEEADWLLTLYAKAVNGIRAYSLPKKKDGAIKITVPSLIEQARTFRKE